MRLSASRVRLEGDEVGGGSRFGGSAVRWGEPFFARKKDILRILFLKDIFKGYFFKGIHKVYTFCIYFMHLLYAFTLCIYLFIYFMQLNFLPREEGLLPAPAGGGNLAPRVT